jgi:anti-sigma B factor antagonist
VANAEAFRAAAEAAIGEARHVVLDMRPVEFVDSSGLSVLMALERTQRRRDGGLRLAGLQRQVWTVFEVTRLYRRFEVYDTLAEAVASFSDER